jgi:hypothetical protein
MSNKISIDYSLSNRNTSCVVSLLYTRETNEDILAINCHIQSTEPKVLPWLHLKGFEIKSILSDGAYSPLFNDQNYVRSVEAALFIDTAYKAIMTKEKLRLHSDAFNVQ